MSIIILCTVIIFLISIFKGSAKFDSIININKCSFNYWILQFLFLPISLLLIVFLYRKFTTDYEHKVKVGY